MKATLFSGLLLSASLGTLAALAQQPADSTNTQKTADIAVAAPTNTVSAPANAPAEAPPPAATTNTVSAVATNAPPPSPATPAPAPVVVPEIDGDKGLTLNFRGAPLETVLNYLSQAAGFIITPAPGLDVRGRVDIWSQQPVSKDEAVDLLNTILRKNGYAAVRDGRKIDIKTLEDAKRSNIPVKMLDPKSEPDTIPNNDEVVTQIIPVRYANALQMTKDLQPLLPSFATMTANESGNALVLTDAQSDIRRIAQIVRALDTSISGISTIRVFPLRYADAKDLATELKEIFPPPSNTAQGNMGRGGFGRFGGGGFPGMPGGPGADPTVGTGQSEARKAASRVTAVADERTNSLVVSAPDEVMPTIEELVKQIDTNAENITELRVFKLVYADPQEMADLLSNVFPDESNSTSGNRSTVQFGRGGFGGRFGAMMGGGNAAQATGTSTRARQKGKVTAVADARTASVIVSAASDLMPQIAEMITQLDSNPAKKQKVFVYSLENADVDNVQQVLQDMFQSQTTRNTSRNNQNNNPLATRQQNQGYGNTSSSGFGGSSGGGSGGGTRRLGN